MKTEEKIKPLLIDEEIDLKPCPFCGGTAHITQEGINTLAIKCEVCKTQVTQKVLQLSLDWLRDKMTINWNSRKLESELAQREINHGATAHELMVAELKIKQKDERIKELEGLLEDAFNAGAEFQYATQHYHKDKWVNYQAWKEQALKRLNK